MGRTRKKTDTPAEDPAKKKYAVMYRLEIGLEQIIEAESREDAQAKFHAMLKGENVCIKVYRPIGGFEPYVKVGRVVKI